MDITVSAAAASLGTSVPRVTRAIDSLGITPKRRPAAGGTRQARTIDAAQLERLRQRLGSSEPSERFSREELFVLAALNLSPFGFRSVRAAAAAAGVSTTTASKVLARFVAEGLVRAPTRKVLDSGRVAERVVYEANREGEAWQQALEEIRTTRTPEPDSPLPPKMVPRRFWHLFWNASPSTLPVSENGDFVASRMLLSRDPKAVAWAALNLPASSIRRTADLRHVSERDRQWLINLARSMSASDPE